MDATDQTALEGVLDDTATCATEQIIQKEKELVQWFRDQKVTVNEIDITAVPRSDDEASQRRGRDLGPGHLRQAPGDQVTA